MQSFLLKIGQIEKWQLIDQSQLILLVSQLQLRLQVEGNWKDSLKARRVSLVRQKRTRLIWSQTQNPELIEETEGGDWWRHNRHTYPQPTVPKDSLDVVSLNWREAENENKL